MSILNPEQFCGLHWLALKAATACCPISHCKAGGALASTTCQDGGCIEATAEVLAGVEAPSGESGRRLLGCSWLVAAGQQIG